MTQLQSLIKPVWSVEKWLENAWSILTENEKQIISQRVDDMFHTPLPFQLEKDKSLYLHLFSLLTQLEIFGLHGLIKSLDKLPEGELKIKFRQQIIDEIFHAIVFAKLTFELSSPYSLPPAHSKGIEKFLSYLVNEHDLKTSLVLINLVAEGWIEEIFLALQEINIAPAIFDVILADESKHVEDSALFLEIGLPDSKQLAAKLSAFEEELIMMISSEFTYAPTLVNFLGVPGAKKLFHNIDKKHCNLLKKINLKPGKYWQTYMSNIPFFVDNIFHDQSNESTLELTGTRKMFTALWEAPSQPTQSSVFSLDITPVGFFEKKYPPETVTCLLLQALSKAMDNFPHIRNYMCHHKIYNTADSYVGLAVLIPGSQDHLSMIEFKNCHNMSLPSLARHIIFDVKMMTYCFQRSRELQKQHPWLADIVDEVFVPHDNSAFRHFRAPQHPRPAISVSNIGHWGYELPISPLFPNEAVKLTLGKIERKQVWNNTSKAFEIKDLLPVGLSVDHRVFDANIPIPALMQTGFDQVLAQMQENVPTTEPLRTQKEVDKFIQNSERALKSNLDIAFRTLIRSSHIWANYRPNVVMQAVYEDE